jgi:hypothetical protein
LWDATKAYYKPLLTAVCRSRIVAIVIVKEISGAGRCNGPKASAHVESIYHRTLAHMSMQLAAMCMVLKNAWNVEMPEDPVLQPYRPGLPLLPRDPGLQRLRIQCD